MPVPTSYPGVFTEEVPSGVHPIAGVPTAVAAFIGRARRGPIDRDPRAPVVVNSYADFERSFGGLWLESGLGYAVRDFFLNGGSEAVIVRVHHGATAATFDLPTGASAPDNLLPLEAASVGAWGGELSIAVDHATDNSADPQAFNLVVTAPDGTSETFLNVSVDPNSPRFVPRVLEQSSSLLHVRVDDAGNWIVPNVRPSAGGPITAQAGTASDGNPITATDIAGSTAEQTGLYALEKIDLFNLLCIPPPEPGADTPAAVYQEALAYCVSRRAMLIVDAPLAWAANPASAASEAIAGLPSLGLAGDGARNAALYFPRLRQADPLREDQLDVAVPCGAVAGVFARTDAQRGVWKAPAGLDAALIGAAGLQVNLTDAEVDQLNPLGINCLRSFPASGPVVWGSRTLRGADLNADDYKYVPVRRLALFIEESLDRGTRWVAAEPNDEPLWAQLRLSVGAFLHTLFLQGAFRGSSPRDACFVSCDRSTMNQDDIDHGIVNIHVGFAPLKPAEFVMIRLQQIAGQHENTTPAADTVTVTGAARRFDLSKVQRIETSATWSDLVLPEQTSQRLREIAAQLRQRTRAYASGALAARPTRGVGLSALFSGPRGTGKTLAAEVLATELKLELRRIELSQIVSRYIGETEKNLRSVFDAAGDGGAILLFDEADALFRKRSEVKDSHDRYANIEVSYLLQRIEAYRGLTILATHARDTIDPAFLRRLRFVVTFPCPDVAQRAEIRRRVFPREVRRTEDGGDNVRRNTL